MKWENWVIIREAEQNQQDINVLFKGAFDKINKMITDFHKALADGVKQLSASGITSQFRDTMVSTLDNLLSKLKGTQSVRTEGIVREIDRIITEAENGINAPAWMGGEPSKGRTAAGKPIYGLDRVIDKLKSNVEKVLQDLQQQVTKQSMAAATAAGVSPTSTSSVTAGNMPNLDSKPTGDSVPFDPNDKDASGDTQADRAYYNLQMLATAQQFAPNKLNINAKSPGKKSYAPIQKLDPSDGSSLERGVKRLSGHRIVQLSFGNERREVDITNTQKIVNFLQDHGLPVGN